MIPKAELHCHLEGAIPPQLALRQAEKYGVDVASFLQDGAYRWTDFTTFLAAYDGAASLFRSVEDYALLTEAYLAEIAEAGAIYSEIFISPDHARTAGLAPEAYLEGIEAGIAKARRQSGIECRLIVVGVRHFGPEAVEAAARFAVANRGASITGFGMAGEERFGAVGDYAAAFDIAREAGLGITIHGGELCGAESVRAALDIARPSRIGHGVRAIEDERLVERIAAEGVVLETCPGSNIALGVFGSFAEHPFPALRKAGCKVTLNSDDPPFFHTSLANEYAIAERHFALTPAELVAVTRTAIDAAFVDEDTRSRLHARVTRLTVHDA
jgi:adenosine deaminase